MTLRSSTRPLLQAPHTRTAYGSRAFSSAVPAIRNNLPTSVTEAKSLPAFRRRLKTICLLLLLKTVVNCNLASASVSLHTFSFMALYKFVFNFNFNYSEIRVQRVETCFVGVAVVQRVQISAVVHFTIMP